MTFGADLIHLCLQCWLDCRLYLLDDHINEGVFLTVQLRKAVTCDSQFVVVITLNHHLRCIHL